MGFASTASQTSAADSHTHSTVPQQNSSFIGDLQTFLKSEDAARYIAQFQGMVVSGGVDATGGTLTHTPTSLTAYPGGYLTLETGSVTYVSNSTCYLIAHRLNHLPNGLIASEAFRKIPDSRRARSINQSYFADPSS